MGYEYGSTRSSGSFPVKYGVIAGAVVIALIVSGGRDRNPAPPPAAQGGLTVDVRVLVAGQERGVLPMGVWSTSRTRSICSQPEMPTQPCQVGDCRLPTAWARLSSRTSRAKVDLPDPETPVTTLRRPMGKRASTLCRLCRWAPATSKTWPP